ncbi:hypothetical protein MIV104L [Invertebrate iridescent virus 3]|uniref:Putative CTD phosphatase-like protein 355R n=1 Tax=Invertebrate iridescent virus 3 TaxID=345201 RepID=VF355_IIV3|nr:hypothetical protein MIV104L [Invertebrate iridescent virus 3]Q196V6.1 RecName: Full=Putative CTD phosphatase-like protein 355R [Invertebrate iridescent virus 3]ABF82134.1 hypothetical protein MIV104L [Invertebrate iridescent virus 3]
MENNKKKLILLDLDNTLICAEDLDTVKDKKRLSQAQKQFRTVRMEDYYDIFERPHLQEFLDYLFKNFKVGVWTASSKDYAIFVIKNFITAPQNKVKPDRKIEIFLCSHHCNVSKKYFKGISKDLKLVTDQWKIIDLSQVKLVDDLEKLANHQPENVIHVKPFFYDEPNSKNDTELLKVQKTLETFK